MILVYSLLGLVLFCLVHLFADRLRFLDGTPRSRWLSAAGGISLAYVFLHFLPELAEGQSLVREGEGGAVAVPWVEFELYGLALVGLLVYYGAERLVQSHHHLGRSETPDGTAGVEGIVRGAERAEDAVEDALDPNGDDTSEASEPVGAHTRHHGTFWVHLLSFAVYNVLAGYLLVRRGEAEHDRPPSQAAHTEPEAVLSGWELLQEEADIALLTFAIALAIHFLVTDYGLREDFRAGYMRLGRYVLCAAAAAGWLLGVFVALPEIAVLALIALLGGGIILNVLKEELPAERESRFSALVAGALGYAVLLGFAH